MTGRDCAHRSRRSCAYLQGGPASTASRPLVRTGTRVTACVHDDATGRWRIETEAGAGARGRGADRGHRSAQPTRRSRTCPGASASPATASTRPAGTMTMSWPASAWRWSAPAPAPSSSCPRSRPRSTRLTVFQRTGNWMLPRENRRYSARYPRADPAACAHQLAATALRLLLRRAADAAHPPSAHGGADRRAALVAVHAPPASRSRAARQGLARLHVRLQAGPVQLPLPAGARPPQRRAGHRPDRRRSPTGGIRTADGRERRWTASSGAPAFGPRSSCSRWRCAAPVESAVARRGPMAPTLISGSPFPGFRRCSSCTAPTRTPRGARSSSTSSSRPPTSARRSSICAGRSRPRSVRAGRRGGQRP